VRDPNDISPTFCVLPWIHISTRTSGKTQICCLSMEDVPGSDGRPFRLGQDSYAEVWNSDYLRDARARMLRGERVAACRKCYDEEALGSHSMRIGMSSAWLASDGPDVERRIEQSRHNDHRVDAPPIYLDLRQGNLCNLRCRSCGPENSVMIEREYRDLAARDPWFKATIHHGQVEPQVADWYEQPKFLDELRGLLPGVRKLYFTGGEPTLIDSNYALMEECVQKGFAANIELMFNTNLMLLPQQFLELLPAFRFTLLNLSIEGTGVVQEYLRFPSKWGTIEKNLRKLLEARIGNVYLAVNPVVQLANALCITDLFRFLQELNQAYDRRIQVLPIILDDPRYLDMSVLPEPARQAAIARLASYKEELRPTGLLDSLFESRVDQIMEKLRQPAPADVAELRAQFRRFTAMLDESRGQSFARTFPELAQLIEHG
jgi:sulfatase maturation enzyme AslB (radical SAM superfamily)